MPVAEWVEVLLADVDLCPRGLERLKAKIVAGVTPPIERPRKKQPGQEALEK